MWRIIRIRIARLFWLLCIYSRRCARACALTERLFAVLRGGRWLMAPVSIWEAQRSLKLGAMLEEKALSAIRVGALAFGCASRVRLSLNMNRRSTCAKASRTSAFSLFPWSQKREDSANTSQQGRALREAPAAVPIRYQGACPFAISQRGPLG